MILTSFSFKVNATVDEVEVIADKYIDNDNNSYEVISGYSYSFDEKLHFYYSDGYFYNDPTIYNEHLASMSLNMAATAFPDVDEDEDESTRYLNQSHNITKLLEDIGCEYVEINDYYKEKMTTDSIGVAVGIKKINLEGKEYTLIPIAIRGANYKLEWVSNVTLGLTGEAAGFSSAATQVMEFVEEIIAKYNIDVSTTKFWLAGYSRAGATANLTSKRLIDTYGEKGAQVYGYCFEAPQGGYDEDNNYDPSKYYSIHNVINYEDIVPRVAPSYMGFFRYGVDHYVPGSDAGEVVVYQDEYGVTHAKDNEYTKTDNLDSDYLEHKAKMLDNIALITYGKTFTQTFINLPSVTDTSFVSKCINNYYGSGIFQYVYERIVFIKDIEINEVKKFCGNKAPSGDDIIGYRYVQEYYNAFHYALKKVGHLDDASDYVSTLSKIEILKLFAIGIIANAINNDFYVQDIDQLTSLVECAMGLEDASFEEFKFVASDYDDMFELNGITNVNVFDIASMAKQVAKDSKNLTMADYNNALIEKLQDYAIGSRTYYLERNPFDITGLANFTIQDSFRSMMTLIFGMSKEELQELKDFLDFDNQTSNNESSTDSKYSSTNKKNSNNTNSKTNISKYSFVDMVFSFADKLWDEVLEGKAVLDNYTSEELEYIYNGLLTVENVAKNFAFSDLTTIARDIFKTVSSADGSILLTAIKYGSRIGQAHFTQVNIGWLYSYDSYYDTISNEQDKISTFNIRYLNEEGSEVISSKQLTYSSIIELYERYGNNIPILTINNYADISFYPKDVSYLETWKNHSDRNIDKFLYVVKDDETATIYLNYEYYKGTNKNLTYGVNVVYADVEKE